MTARAQGVVPLVSYEDVDAAAVWLAQAFGFGEQTAERVEDDEGRVTHVVMTTAAGGVVFLGWPGGEYESPMHHRAGCEAAARWLDTPFVIDGVLVYVDDVDAHADRARAAGARVIRGPETIPIGRLYSAEDAEGHRWMFMQPS
jgi:uncharacterized glyoxalase superfamily protein PhnB